ncbi:unnamed protein product [Ilex paraguariensis]|uniref:CASP-like protein n=1 Tax=Ilex paraguariensis TaxID=185542 RepID=A0ABC8U6S7_9AQUA
MDGIGAKVGENQPVKTQKYFAAAQICLRALVTAATLAAAWIMLTTKETVVVFGIVVDARYSYSSAFKFFAVANLVACVTSALCLLFTSVLGHKDLGSKNYFYMFLVDLVIIVLSCRIFMYYPHEFELRQVVMILLMAGCAAATAIGFVGRYGNSHTGWMAICDHFAKFCNRATVSVMFSFLAFILYLCLTIISANKSRQIQA